MEIEEGSVLASVGVNAFLNTMLTGVIVLPATITSLASSSFYIQGNSSSPLIIAPEAAYSETVGTDSLWYSVTDGQA